MCSIRILMLNLFDLLVLLVLVCSGKLGLADRTFLRPDSGSHLGNKKDALNERLAEEKLDFGGLV